MQTQEKYIGLRLTPDLHDRLQDRANSLGWNVSEYIRVLIVRDINERARADAKTRGQG